MEQIRMNAEARESTGKGPTRRLRQKGLVPAILYGPHRESQALSIPFSELREILRGKLGENILIELEIKGREEPVKKTVMVKDYQIHPIKRTIEHIDLYEISMDEKIRVSVPITIRGTPPGVEKGGTLTQSLRSLEIECLPRKIPEHIEVDVSSLDWGDSIHVSDLKLAEEITILTDKQTALVSIIAPAAEEAEEKVPEEEVGEETQ